MHGGPTGNSVGALDLEKTVLPSRGIGVLDVNYGGFHRPTAASTASGCAPVGVVDVEDAIAAAGGWRRRLGDPARIAIRGGSAGGWTVMAACCASDAFAGGVSYYGVGELTGSTRPPTTSSHATSSGWSARKTPPCTPSREPVGRVAG
ncbi:alpha/beta hydrolase family protein [Streptosporangium vulgare]|uniref:alpha/beta hydrolase family protein n=1 Tax=Streptosporangium vulgare TaxID=46190 RepID=UPI0031CF642A